MLSLDFERHHLQAARTIVLFGLLGEVDGKAAGRRQFRGGHQLLGLLGRQLLVAKPADADDVFNAMTQRKGEKTEVPENPMSADRVRWEHIQRVYEMCERNVSETARRLNMHRRTLQRILAKRAPK